MDHRTGSTPKGSLNASAQARRPLGAIGDSAILDIFGLGGMLRPDAPHEILGRAHRSLSGIRVGTSAATVSALGTSPVIVLGIIDASGEAGRIGGGVYVPPVHLFDRASAGLEIASSA